MTGRAGEVGRSDKIAEARWRHIGVWIEKAGALPRSVRAGIVAAVLLPALAAMCWGKLAQHNRLQTTTFDLGIQANVSWNLGHGNGFYDSVHGWNYLGDHFSPIHVLTAGLLLAWPSPAALLVLQCVAIVLAGGGVYRLGRVVAKDWGIALLLMGVFLASPYLHKASRFDYHPVMLAVPCYVWLLVFLERRCWRAFFAVAALACLMKENVPLALAGVGIMMCFRRPWRKPAAALLVGSLALFAVEAFWLMPLFLGRDEHTHLIRYADLGRGPGEILRNLLRPGVFLRNSFLDPGKVVSLGRLLLSFGLLPLAAGWFLIPAVGPILWNMLSGSDFQWRYDLHYSASIVPFLTYAAAHGAVRLRGLIERWRGPRESGAAIAVILAAIVLAGLLRIEPYARPQDRPETAAAFRRAAAEIDPHASVAASNDFGPHLSLRRNTWLFDQDLVDRGCRDADWIVVNLGGPFFAFTFASRSDCCTALLSVLSRGDYGVTSLSHDVLVLRRGAPTDGNAAVADHIRALRECGVRRP